MSRIKEALRKIAFSVPYVGPKYRQLLDAAEYLHRINPGHYSSPIPSAEEIDREEAATSRIEDDSLPGIPLRTAAQLELLNELGALLASHPFSTDATNSNRYYFDNDWFQFTDGMILHGLIRLYRPKQIVEIGSGFSSCVILDTMETDANVESTLTMIEPNCERLRSRLRVGDESSVRLVDATLQDAPANLFDELGKDDLLLVDSSHVSKCDSDVNLVIHEILPRLGPGVLVHFHDIFFPFRYPRRLLENDHYWNEAYILRAFLEQNERFEITLWNDYLKTRHSEAVAAALHAAGDDIACSFWMRSV